MIVHAGFCGECMRGKGFEHHIWCSNIRFIERQRMLRAEKEAAAKEHQPVHTSNGKDYPMHDLACICSPCERGRRAALKELAEFRGTPMPLAEEA